MNCLVAAILVSVHIYRRTKFQLPSFH